MRKLVYVLIALFAIITLLRAYTDVRETDHPSLSITGENELPGY